MTVLTGHHAGIIILIGVVSGAPSASPVLSALSGTARFSWEIPQGGLGIGFTFYAVSPAGDTVFVVFDDGTFETPANYRDRLVYQGNIAARNVTFTLSNIQTSDAGTYKCANRGTNSVIQNCGQKLVVLGKPTTPGRPVSTTPVYNQQVTLTCSSTSTTVPADHGLTLTYTWQRDNTDNTVTSPGSPYTFMVSSRDSHSYRCRARESQGLESEWSQVYNMEPEYGPYQISLTPSTTSYTVTEHQALPSVICSALCRPGCSYRWLHNGTDFSSGAMLKGKADRSKTGFYRCQPNNTHGSNDSVRITVDVQYPSDITMFTINSHSGPVTVNESDPATLSCQVDSSPGSVITLKKGTEELTRADNSLTATHKLAPVDCRQRGNYSCTATNNIGASASQRVELLVNCSPRLDDTVSQELKFAAALDSDVTLSVTVLAYPFPTFTWSRSISTSQNLTGSSSPASDISVTARLHLTNLQQQDFGYYNLTVGNGVGSSVSYKLNIVIEASSQTALIAGVTVSVCVVLLVVLVSVLMIQRRRTKGDDTEGITSKGRGTNTTGNELEMQDNVCYVGSHEVMKSGASGSQGVPEVYAAVDKKRLKPASKTNEVCAEVKKPGNMTTKNKAAKNTKAKKATSKDDKTPLKTRNKKGRKGDVYENTGIGEKGNPHINHVLEDEPENTTAGAKTGRNKDGLLYVGIDFSNHNPSQHVNRDKETTEYAGIQIGVVGPALAQEEKKQEDKK